MRVATILHVFPIKARPVTTFRFRLLLSLYIAVSAAAIVAPYIAPGALSPAIQAALDNEPTPFLSTYPALALALILPAAIAVCAGTLGLFLFKPWARTFSLVGTIAVIPAFFFFGVSVYSGLEMALVDVSAMLWGAVLAMAYYSPVSSRFAVPASS
jgi:hypothetical protein